MAYLGNTPTTQSFISGTDYFNGNGSTVAFTLSRTVVSVNDIEAVVNNVVQQPNSAYTISGTTITFTSAPSAGTANIYVRYLSTTTQSITPSQGTVGNNQFANNISAIPMTYGTIGAGNASIMKNRIINGAMVIDQRNAGASVATSSGTEIYTLDRWIAVYSATSKYTVQQNSGSVTPPAGFTNYLGVTSTAATTVGASDYYFVGQSIEGFNVADLGFGTANASTVTVSFWVRSSLTGTFGGVLKNDSTFSYPFSYTISAANTWEQKSVTIAGQTAGTWNKTNSAGMRLFFSLGSGSTFSGTAGAWAAGNLFTATGATSVVGTSGATFYITGVQLEVGSNATGFEYRQYGQELALCQRYYQITDSMAGSGRPSATEISMMAVFCTPMRASPTVSAFGGVITVTEAGIVDKTQSSTSVNIESARVSTRGAQIYFGNFSSITSQRPYLQNTNGNGAAFSAEL